MPGHGAAGLLSGDGERCGTTSSRPGAFRNALRGGYWSPNELLGSAASRVDQRAMASMGEQTLGRGRGDVPRS